jgi:hypothetical protein
LASRPKSIQPFGHTRATLTVFFAARRLRGDFTVFDAFAFFQRARAASCGRFRDSILRFLAAHGHDSRATPEQDD